MKSIVVLGLLGLLVGRAVASHLLRGMVAVATVCAVALIGASRLYLGVHWLSDVVAGWLLGGAFLAVCLVVSWWPRRPSGVDVLTATVPQVRSPHQADAGRAARSAVTVFTTGSHRPFTLVGQGEPIRNRGAL